MKQFVAPLLGAVLLAGCQSTPMAAENMAVCIISGQDANGGPSEQFMGQTVHFCCKRCKSKWDSMDAEGKKNAFDAFNK